MMKVDFRPSVSFKSDYQANSSNLLESVQPVKGVTNEELLERIEKLETQLLEVKETEEQILPQKSKSFKEKVKTGIANVWKFFSVAGTMSYAAAKGTFYGAVVGAGTLLSAMVLRAPKLLKAEGSTLATIYKHPFKSAGKAGTAISALGAIGTLAGFLVAGRLKANQNSAVIEHKIDVAHIND